VGIDGGWEGCGRGVNGTQHDVNGRPVIDTAKFPNMRAMTDYAHTKGIRMVGRCRLTLSKPVLEAPMVSALETGIS